MTSVVWFVPERVEKRVVKIERSFSLTVFGEGEPNNCSQTVESQDKSLGGSPRWDRSRSTWSLPVSREYPFLGGLPRRSRNGLTWSPHTDTPTTYH